jgi:hypothetical protein
MNIEIKNKIDAICKKNQNWKKLFYLWFTQNDNLDIDKLELSFLIFLKHKNLLKTTIQPNLFENLSDVNNMVDFFDDTIKKNIYLLQKESFIKSLKTKKYLHLFNDVIDQEINLLIDNKIDKEMIKKHLFSQLFNYNTSEDLLTDITTFKHNYLNWNKEYYINQINENRSSTKIIKETPTSIMIQVFGYNSSKSLGSDLWCLSKHRGTFDRYTSNLNRQFFYLDFSKNIIDKTSLIGFTVDMMGGIINSFIKNNTPTDDKTLSRFTFSGLDINFIDNYIGNIANYNIALKTICQYKINHLLNKYLNQDDIDITEAFISALNNNNREAISIILKHKKASLIIFDFETLRLASFYEIEEIFDFLPLTNNVHTDIPDIEWIYLYISPLYHFKSIVYRNKSLNEKEKLEKNKIKTNHNNVIEEQSFIKWNINDYLKYIKKEDLNISILKNNNNKLILRINHKSAFKILTASSIDDDETEKFSSILKERLNSIILKLNFNKNISDHNSIHLFSIDFDGFITDNTNNKNNFISDKTKKKFTKKHRDILTMDINKELINQRILALDNKEDQFFYLCIYNMNNSLINYLNQGYFDSLIDDGFYDVRWSFIWACMKGHIEIVKVLLKKINTKTITCYKNRALLIAYTRNQLDILNLLLNCEDIVIKINIKWINSYIKNEDKQQFIDKMLYFIENKK